MQSLKLTHCTSNASSGNLRVRNKSNMMISQNEREVCKTGKFEECIILTE